MIRIMPPTLPRVVPDRIGDSGTEHMAGSFVPTADSVKHVNAAWGHEIPVPDALRPWVSDVRGVTADADQGVLTHPPEASTALVFRVLDDRHGDLMVVGPRTHARYHRGKHVPFGIRLRIRLSRASLLLGVPVGELVDQAVPLRDLWGAPGDRLAHELAGLGSDHMSVLKRIEAEFLARISLATPGDLSRSDLVQAAIAGLSTSTGARPEPVPAIARRLGISERHLRDLFNGAVGVSPKRFARIDRLRTVLARARNGSWARLAVEAGYYDQSHLTGEFREAMGVPPGSFVTGHLPTPTPCGTSRPLGPSGGRRTSPAP
ncbi:helix-turn-helix domain-containing protein [Streptosporangium sandarakinum]|uniref:helix-turn-helix domain-containing protein n=1 Tax=Streptosporangium sandarakinum TaxID=1260955 RepID=UPI003674453B